MKHLLIVFFLICSFQLFAQREYLYVGTFSERDSKGIYVYEFDREDVKLSLIQTFTHKTSPSFLDIHPNKKYLYAAYREGMTAEDKNGTITAFSIDPSTGKINKINEQSSEGAGPCHVSVDPKGKFVYVSNYGGGNLTVYPINLDGSLGKASQTIQHEGSSINKNRQNEPHMHSIMVSNDGKYLYASDLGIDKIAIYQNNNGHLSKAKVPFVATTPGSGPRHFAIHPTGKFAFSMEELSSTVASYKVDKVSGALLPVSRESSLPKDKQDIANTGADIHVSPDGRFVYASNRGHDSLVIFSIDQSTGELTYIGNESTQGAHPRNFCLDKKGEFAFVGNRDTDNLVVLKRDAKTGKLSPTGYQISMPLPVCIKQVILP